MGTRDRKGCRVGVAEGEELLSYAFPSPHPFGRGRAEAFWRALAESRLGVETIKPEKAEPEVLALFQTEGHIEAVRRASVFGYGYLDQGDTPAFPGVFEAASYAAGTTLACAQKVLDGELDHAFNPLGGLHHASRSGSAGFCVFNDIGITIEMLRSVGLRRILYVDIDVHHGDGVYYAYEEDPDLFIYDIHEDGRYLYPGTGAATQNGYGRATGTKINVPLLPGSGDAQVEGRLQELENFARQSRPEFIIFQCGADGLAGDPLGGLGYTPKAHGMTCEVLHKVAHDACAGRMIALGGGGYKPENCASAWVRVVETLSRGVP